MTPNTELLFNPSISPVYITMSNMVIPTLTITREMAIQALYQAAIAATALVATAIHLTKNIVQGLISLGSLIYESSIGKSGFNLEVDQSFVLMTIFIVICFIIYDKMYDKIYDKVYLYINQTQIQNEKMMEKIKKLDSFSHILENDIELITKILNTIESNYTKRSKIYENDTTDLRKEFNTRINSLELRVRKLGKEVKMYE